MSAAGPLPRRSLPSGDGLHGQGGPLKRRLAALLLAAVASAAANERLPVAPDRIVALLAMPLFGEHGCALREPKSVPLYADAALARPIGRLHAAAADADVDCAAPRLSWHLETPAAAGGELPTEEFDYERPGAIVLETRGQAARVALAARKSAWVGVGRDMRVLRLAGLYRDALTYIDHDWVGALYTVPNDRSTRHAIDAKWVHRIGRVNVVKVLRVRELPDNTWIEIELGPAAPGCADSPEPLPVQRGWVPAYARSGWPLVWFHSRGC